MACRLEQRARAEARKDDWLARIKGPTSARPTAYVVPIVAREKVLAGTGSVLASLLRQRKRNRGVRRIRNDASVMLWAREYAWNEHQRIRAPLDPRTACD